MDKSRPFYRALRPLLDTAQSRSTQIRPYICAQCLRRTNPIKPSTLRAKRLKPSPTQKRFQSTQQPADSPAFHSIVDNPPTLIRSGRKHKPWGLALLAAIPVISFGLGCWQVQRLGWKTDLIARFEDRLVREPLPLPPVIDPSAVADFDYRRITTRGKFLHDKECLIGPRLHDGQDGYLVITPLDRSATFPPSEGRDANTTANTTVLVCRGWIPKSRAAQSSRPAGLSPDTVTVQGLLREPWKKNLFTPSNRPEKGEWYFPDVHEMAAHTGSQAIWIEETMRPDLLASYDRESKGIPIGRPAEVNLRNNHAQYIFTWFSLSAATSLMLWMVVKRPPGGGVRQNRKW